MKASEIDAQYATGLSRQGVEQALLDAGKDMGRIATGQLAELARITSRDRVLDAGTGIGGTARFLAATYGCQVTAIDLTREYCDTASWLNKLTGLDGKITVSQGNVTDLPFAGAAFDVVTSQHVQMNVADKAAQLRAAIEAAGFVIDHWADLTDQAVTLMQAVLSRE